MVDDPGEDAAWAHVVQPNSGTIPVSLVASSFAVFLCGVSSTSPLGTPAPLFPSSPLYRLPMLQMKGDDEHPDELTQSEVQASKLLEQKTSVPNYAKVEQLVQSTLTDGPSPLLLVQVTSPMIRKISHATPSQRSQMGGLDTVHSSRALGCVFEFRFSTGPG